MSAVPALRSLPEQTLSLPASIPAEQAAIGAVLILREVPPDLADFLPDDFFLPAHREIWAGILALQGRAQPIDHIALEEEIKGRGALGRMEGGAEYLLTCAASTPTAENVAHYAKIIRDNSALRRLITVCTQIGSRCYGKPDFEAVMGSLRDDIAGLETVGSGGGPVRVGDEMVAIFETLELKAKEPSRYAVMTGISRFDNRLGGLRPGRLIVVAATPGLGKSAWAGNIAVYNALRRVPALLFSVEMDRQELIERFLAGQAEIPVQEIGSGDALRDVERRNVLWGHAGTLTADDVPLFIDDRESLALGQLIGTARRWYAKTLGPVPPKDQAPKPAIVLVDYIQLLAGDDPDEDNRNVIVGTITRGLKRLAKSLRIPVVALSQLNREVTKRGGKPRLSDLRDSGSIEQDADQVIFLAREEQRDAEGREVKGQPGKAELLVGKNRGGKTGSIPVWWEPQFTRFRDIEDTNPHERD